MSHINYRAVRAFVAAINRSTRYAAELQGAEADMQIDAGEWSSRFHEDALGRIEAQIAEQVAQRFGLTARQLDEHSVVAGYEEHERFLKAPPRRRGGTYRLGSCDLVDAPGLIAWAINGYAHEVHRKYVIDVIRAAWPSVPETAVRALLSKKVPYTIDAKSTVVFHMSGRRSVKQ